MRWTVIAALAVAATHCKEAEQTAVTVRLGAAKLAEDEAKRKHDNSACGGPCGANQLCNHLYTPPRCAPTIPREGDRCGLAANGVFHNCDIGYTCEGPSGQTKCVATGDGGPCRVVSNNIEPECSPGFACFADGKCHPACPGCNQPFEHCNTLYDPPRCFPNQMPDGTKCGRYSGSKVFRECAGVCAGKPGEQVCVHFTGEGNCHYRKCPDGMRCDRDETCVPTESK